MQNAKMIGEGYVYSSGVQSIHINSKKQDLNKGSLGSHIESRLESDLRSQNKHHWDKRASIYNLSVRARLGSNDSYFLKATGIEMQMKN